MALFESLCLDDLRPGPVAVKAPTFAGCHPASAVASKAKRMNRCADTRHEVLLRRALFRLGLRFRKNVTTLPGKPDIVFPSAKAVVFCDGDFWHGRNFRRLRRKLMHGHNAGYWLAKISANIRRDRRNNAALKASGWRVVRMWETDIVRNPVAAATRVAHVIAPAKSAGLTKAAGSASWE
jgi:DNA mismatch endonuclease, patch repair protein